MSSSVPPAARRREALELSLSGCNEDTIAERLGVTTRSVRRYLRQARDQLARETVQDAAILRVESSQRLAMIRAAQWKRVDDPQAATVLLRVEDRFAKLWGLDAPSQVQHSIDPGEVRSFASVAIRVGVSKFGVVIEALAQVLAEQPVASQLAEVYELAVAERDAWLVELEAASSQLPSGEQAA